MTTTKTSVQGKSTHPFDKVEARKAIKESPLSNWLQEACLARIDDADMPDSARMLLGMIMVYMDMELKQAKSRRDFKKVCELCQYSFKLRGQLYLKTETMICDKNCEYYIYEYGPHF